MKYSDMQNESTQVRALFSGKDADKVRIHYLENVIHLTEYFTKIKSRTPNVISLEDYLSVDVYSLSSPANLELIIALHFYYLTYKSNSEHCYNFHHMNKVFFSMHNLKIFIVSPGQISSMMHTQSTPTLYKCAMSPEQNITSAYFNLAKMILGKRQPALQQLSAPKYSNLLEDRATKEILEILYKIYKQPVYEAGIIKLTIFFSELVRRGGQINTEPETIRPLLEYLKELKEKEDCEYAMLRRSGTLFRD